MRAAHGRSAAQMDQTLSFVREDQKLSLATEQVTQFSDTVISALGAYLSDTRDLVAARSDGLAERVASAQQEQARLLEASATATLERLHAFEAQVASDFDRALQAHERTLAQVTAATDRLALTALQQDVCALVTAKAAEAEARAEFSDAASAAVKSVVDGTAPKVDALQHAVERVHVDLRAAFAKAEEAQAVADTKLSASLNLHAKTPGIPALIDKMSDRLAGLLEPARLKAEPSSPRPEPRPVELDASSVRLLEEANTRLRAIHRLVEGIRDREKSSDKDLDKT